MDYQSFTIYVLCELNYYIFIVACIIRVARNRHIGYYNLNAPRTRPYRIKILL